MPGYGQRHERTPPPRTRGSRRHDPLGRELRRAIPEVYKSYAALHAAALGPGALDAKVKELIALGISVASRCDGCIANHARAAVKAGATREEAAEAIGVAIM